MRASVRFAFAAVVAATLVACRDDSLLTGPSIRQASADLATIDLNQYMDITAGDDFTCVTRLSGHAFCWGKNDVGQTGRGFTARDCYGISWIPCTAVPSLVTDANGAPLLASQIDAGGAHVCIADKSRTAWCWGSNGVGQMGLGNTWTTSMPPTPVAGPISVNRISAGGNSTCAQLTNSDISCWGLMNFATAPLVMTNAPGFLSSLSVGAKHACYIPSNSTAISCIGDNTYGQGGWKLIKQLRLGFVQTNLFAPANSIATQENTTCANLVDGTLQCAGMNTNGMLGNNNTSVGSSVTPVSVGSAGPQPLRAVSVGAEHACALDPNGFAFCWGNGQSGELGNGPNPASAAAPVAVGGGHQFRAIAAGRRHTCAITSYEIWCWGDNFYSQLGVFQATPGVPVQAPSPPLPGSIRLRP